MIEMIMMMEFDTLVVHVGWLALSTVVHYGLFLLLRGKTGSLATSDNPIASTAHSFIAISTVLWWILSSDRVRRCL